VGYVNGIAEFTFSLEEPADAADQWTVPWCAFFPTTQYNAADQRTQYAYLNDSDANAYLSHAGTRYNFFMTSEGYLSAMLGQYQTFGSDLDGPGNFPMCPIGMFCDQAGARGRIGRLTDLWWGSVSASEGDHYPADASRQFVQVGDLILPWDGGVAMLTT
jgi:hypothetical protein